MNDKRITRQTERSRKAIARKSDQKPAPIFAVKKVNQLPRLAAIRAELGYTQIEVAELLGTTQQAVGRWENGSREPTLGQLRDLAMMFGCAVADLMGRRLVSGSAPTIEIDRRRRNQLTSGYWGHFGVLLHGAVHTKWYPVTANESNRAFQLVKDACEKQPWITITTLSNRELVVNTFNVRRVCFLPDEGDSPDWHEVQSAYPHEFFLVLSARVRGDVEYEASDALRAMVEEFMQAEAGKDIDDFLHATRVHLADGYQFSYEADDPSELTNFSMFAQTDFENGPSVEGKMVSFSDADGSTFIAPKKIALIEIPIIEMAKGDQKMREEMGMPDFNEDETRFDELYHRDGAGSEG
jgi:transcriptional regulator with XRE-family HTH domain